MSWEFIVRLRDDLDGSTADETIAFGWRGKQYEVDLTAMHAAEFEEFMTRYLKVARPAGGEAVPEPPHGGQNMDQRRFKAAARAWGKEHGWDVEPGGYHPRAMMRAFEEHLKAQAGAA